MTTFRLGVLSAVVAQVLWGLFPIYWKLLDRVNALEVLSHRNFWCAVFLGTLVLISAKRRKLVGRVLPNAKELSQHLFSASLIAANWLVYIWAVQNDHVIDASLGYFLSPLVSVMLGFLVFSEKLNIKQWSAVAFSALGVLIMPIATGVVPWIGLTLAVSFGLYGMVRKQATTGPINGLFIETLLLVPASLLCLYYLSHSAPLSFDSSWGSTELWLILSGLVTAIPLVYHSISNWLVDLPRTDISRELEWFRVYLDRVDFLLF